MKRGHRIPGADTTSAVALMAHAQPITPAPVTELVTWRGWGAIRQDATGTHPYIDVTALAVDHATADAIAHKRDLDNRKRILRGEAFAHLRVVRVRIVEEPR